MSDKNYLKLLYIAALISWLGSAYIFFFKSPASGMGTVALFIFSLSVSFFLTYNFLAAILAQRLSRLPKPVEPLPAIRRAILATVLTVGLLSLAMYHLLNVWVAILLFAMVVVAESFFHAKFKRIPEHEQHREAEE